MLPLIGAAIGALASNANTNSAIAANKQEQQANREYNLNLARMQNQWTIDQWYREAEYNSPAAYRARLQAAGMNPDLAYGNVNGTAPTSGAMTSGAPSQPVDYSMLAGQRTIGDAMAAGLQMKQAEANINSINAGASKTKQETKNLVVEGKILSADVLTRAAQNEQSLQIGRSQVYLNHAIADKTHEEKELIGKQINLATAAYDELQEKIENLRVTRGSMLIQQFQARFDMYMRSQEFNMMCRKLAQDIKESDSRIQLNLQQTKDLMSTMIPRILNLNASTYATKQQGKLTAEQITTELYRQTGIDISNQQMKLNLDSDETYKDVERSVGIATEILNSLSYFVSSILGGASQAKGAGFFGKSMSPIGFR